MDERRPQRRRELSPKEKKALEKQRRKQEEISRKTQRQQARLREDARKKARKNGESHIVVEIPSKPENNRLNRAQDYSTREDYRNGKTATVQRENGSRDRYYQNDRRKVENRVDFVPKKRRKKSIPDIIERETDKRVRNLEATDHKDGFYADEVEIRKAQAKKQRDRRRKKLPKPISPRQRRIRRISAYVCIIATVVIVGVILSLTVLFKTENIYVEGNKYYADDTIIRLSGVSEGENIFMASMYANTDAVSGSLPYVKSAKVNFQIPNTLVINIENATPIYSIKTEGKYYKVSEENRILEQVNSKPKKLTSIIAPSLKSTEVGDDIQFKKDTYTKALEQINECLRNNNYNNITEINIKRISDISITFDKRIKIKIGLPEAIDYKLRTAFAIINEKLDPNNTGKIKGILNVSNCNNTKKSYFKEGSIKETEDKPVSTTPATEETTVRTTYVAVTDDDDDDYEPNYDNNDGDDGDSGEDEDYTEPYE